MSKLVRTTAITLLLIIGVPGTDPATHRTTAQVGPLLAVYVDPATAEPGARVEVAAIASGSGPRVNIKISVPTELTIGDDLRCVHKTSYCNGISSTDGGLVTASAPGNLPGPNGYGSSTQVYVTFSVVVPQSAIPGTRYEIHATMDGLFNVFQPEQGAGSQATTVLTVGSVTGRQPTPNPKPTGNVSQESQEAPGTQSVFVGRTRVRWSENWQFREVGDSTGDHILLSQIDDSVITIVTYGETRHDTISSPVVMLNSFIEPLSEQGKTEEPPVEAGSGELDDGTVWSAYTYELNGFDVTHLVMVSEVIPGRYIISTLLSDTSTFDDSLAIAQQDILLNGNPTFLDGIDAEMIMD